MSSSYTKKLGVMKVPNIPNMWKVAMVDWLANVVQTLQLVKQQYNLYCLRQTLDSAIAR